MVMSFRVSDLQMLLGFVGRSKSGLKHELVTRALQLVQFDCSPELFKKIKELYETRYAKKSSEPVPQPHRPLDPLTMHSTYDRAGTVPRTPLTGPNIDYPVLYGKYLNGLGRLPAKTLKPEVRLVKLPFFNMLDELLKPTELVPQNNEKLQESPCIFALTPRQVELIRNSRELQPGVKAVQVVLRICYSDTSGPQEDQYPPNIAVKVNHSYCSVPGYYPSNKPGVEPKRPCRPINLTHLMYLSSATNRITVTWGNYGKSYSVALYLVRQLTSSELLQRLKTIGVKHPELCKALGEHCGAFPGPPGSVPALTAEPPLLGACRLWGDTHTEPGSLRRSLGDANGAGSQRRGTRGALTDLSVLRVRQGVLSMWGLFGAS